jgi:hypothetical protein
MAAPYLNEQVRARQGKRSLVAEGFIAAHLVK